MDKSALPSLELREVFSKLTLEQVQSMANAIASAQSEPELEATLQEAGDAMPIVNQIQRVVNQHRASGDNRQMDVSQGQLIFLIALYRLAEDQGYIW